MNNPQTTQQSTRSQPEPRRRSFGDAIRNMRLNTRLTLLILVITLPVFTLVTGIIGSRVQTVIQQQAVAQLSQANQAVINSLNIWLTFNRQTIQYLQSAPEIAGLDPQEQTQLLKAFGSAYPQLYLIHTMDLTGQDVARNDGLELRNYGDRQYFIDTAGGNDLAVESLISRTTVKPAVIYAAPVRNAAGEVVQVVSFATEITDISTGINVTRIGTTGYAYIVDPKGRVIAHPDAAFTSELRNLSDYPPVQQLMQGKSGTYPFTDENGTMWESYISRLDSGYGVVIQQESAELYSAMNVARQTNLIGLGIGLAITLFASWFIIRRTLRPIDNLIQAAQEISAGNLDQHVEVRRQDELGILAETFNTMAAQLKGMVGTLENQVQERTRMLQITSEVSRRLSTILDTQQLVREVVEQLQLAFGYYHAHIYLVDPASHALVMAGGTGEAGQIMLHRGHRLQPGQGLVGKSAATKEPVLVADVDQAEGWLPNPLLPDTRAEAAVPILMGNDVLGVLDVQHDVHNGLSQQDVDLLQAIANQVAIALQNAQSYEKTQRSVARQAVGGMLAQRIQQATSVDEVLRTAVEGLGKTLNTQRIGVELHSPTERDSAKSN